jgi:uncharacterized protein
MRSHLANGEPKDRVYQGDQQLYPLLELAEYRRVSGHWPEPPSRDSWSRLVDQLWSALPAERGLLPTDENPADDEAALPYSLSTQILYWYAAARLAAVAGDLGTRVDFDAAASAARLAVAGHFLVDGPFGRQ